MPSSPLSDAAAGAPFATLTPDLILDAVEACGHTVDGRLLALNSYENRVYQVGLADSGSVIAKFYRPARWSDAAILEEHAYTKELAAAEIPVVAPLPQGDTTLFRHADHRFALYPRQGGRAPEFGDPATLERMGRLLGRIHCIGARTEFQARPRLDPDSFGDAARDYLLAHDFLPPDLRPVWQGVIDQALAGVRRCWQRAGDFASLRLHGDCHVGNVLWTDAGPHFVDFDDSRMGPAMQDLWMLLSGDADSMAIQLAHIVAGYEQFAEFDDRQLHLIEALRTLRLIHHAAWLARRWDDPAFPAAFPWFNTQRYWQDRILELREQIAALDEAPVRVGARR